MCVQYKHTHNVHRSCHWEVKRVKGSLVFHNSFIPERQERNNYTHPSLQMYFTGLTSLPVHGESVEVDLTRGRRHEVQSLAELGLERCLKQTEIMV